MIVYSAPPDPVRPIAPNIVVARDAMAAGGTFREYCNRRVDTFRAALPHYHREDGGPGRLHDLDAQRWLDLSAQACGLDEWTAAG